jgi:hypothetical protein
LSFDSFLRAAQYVRGISKNNNTDYNHNDSINNNNQEQISEEHLADNGQKDQYQEERLTDDIHIANISRMILK